MRLDDNFYRTLSSSFTEVSNPNFPIPLRIQESCDHYPVSSILEKIKVVSGSLHDVDILKENMNSVDDLLNPDKYPMYVKPLQSNVLDHGLSRMMTSYQVRKGGFNSFSKKGLNNADYSTDCNLLLVVNKKHLEYLVGNILLKQNVSSSIFEIWLSTPNQNGGHFRTYENNVLRAARAQNIKVVPMDSFDHIFKFYKFPKFKGIKDMNEYLDGLVDKFVQTL